MKRKQKLIFLGALLLPVLATAQSLVADKGDAGSFPLAGITICVDNNEEQLVSLAAGLLQQDIHLVTGKTPAISNTLPVKATAVIIAGTAKSSLIQLLAAKNKISVQALQNKWEAYTIQTIAKPAAGIDYAIVIAGSDRRGLAYGIFELSRQAGVSPWYWWADVPVKKNEAIRIRNGIKIHDAPQVKYRGIFINDEAPALSGWAKEKFGGFNNQFYSKVFELILRLKGNYIWPAMWGNAFYDDDALNIKAAQDYGIVIGTSHHEPLMRAHDEWRRYGTGKWNYDSNEVKLKEFWRAGMQRAQNEKIVSIGMRGDGDEPMSGETATALLERIVKDQRDIIADVTGKPANETPQLWALYKEVQDYYDKGMRVPDDITLLLCDDNWGNLRKLPRPSAKPRKGGYGIYYHFDYVGGPRNYKWVNTNPLPRIWEQIHLAWQHDVKQIWIVNVGDIKPMEFPISFFLDYAWNPGKIDAADLQRYTEAWAAAQFGKVHARDIADLLSLYGKYNGRRKPELLDAGTYSFHYNEWLRVVEAHNALLQKAEQINNALPAESKDAFFQLVLHPVKACANLHEMYYYHALHKAAYASKSEKANQYAGKVEQLYEKDSLITLEYHRLNNGKWNHLMSQTHIGYTYWQQPQQQVMPTVKYIPKDSIVLQQEAYIKDIKRAAVPAGVKGPVFFEDEERGVSIEADHFTKAVNTKTVRWKVLPDHGRTGSAVTAFPVTIPVQQPGKNAPHLQYEIYTYSSGEFTIQAYCSPVLNFHSLPEGTQYAISVDDEAPQIISLNKEDKTSDRGIWNKWAAENIIIRFSRHYISKPGKHTVRFWLVNPGVVLQKLVLDFGHVKPSYLGPPETIYSTINETK